MLFRMLEHHQARSWKAVTQALSNKLPAEQRKVEKLKRSYIDLGSLLAFAPRNLTLIEKLVDKKIFGA